MKTPDRDKIIRIYSPNMKYFLSITYRGTIDIFNNWENAVLNYAASSTWWTSKKVYGPDAHAKDPCRGNLIVGFDNCVEHSMSLNATKLTITNKDSVIWSKNILEPLDSNIKISISPEGSIKIISKASKYVSHDEL